MQTTFIESQIEQALRIAREQLQGVKKKPHYNSNGFRQFPPPTQQGAEITNPRPNPFDAPEMHDWFMDSDDYKL